MQIGEASERTGVSTKMIRHYESIGLIPAADRRTSNYRDYGAEDVHRLGFIRRARDLGFSIEDVFVVGYGLDYAQRHRNLPYVGVLGARSAARLSHKS